MSAKNILPVLSHIQFAILSLTKDHASGKELRRKLRDFGIPKSGPGFYQIMARLERDKFIRGWYEQKIVDGQIIKERYYSVTVPGLMAIQKTGDFYRDLYIRANG